MRDVSDGSYFVINIAVFICCCKFKFTKYKLKLCISFRRISVEIRIRLWLKNSQTPEYFFSFDLNPLNRKLNYY